MLFYAIYANGFGFSRPKAIFLSPSKTCLTVKNSPNLFFIFICLFFFKGKTLFAKSTGSITLPVPVCYGYVLAPVTHIPNLTLLIFRSRVNILKKKKTKKGEIPK
jgi:hypothetical protein